MDNKDTIVALLSQLEHVTEVVVDAIPAKFADRMPEGSVTFRATHDFWQLGDGPSNNAEIYLPPHVFENTENNESVVALMQDVLNRIGAANGSNMIFETLSTATDAPPSNEATP